MALPKFRVRPLAAHSRSNYYETAEAALAAADLATVPVIVEAREDRGQFGPYPPRPVVLVADLVKVGLAKAVAWTQKGTPTHFWISPEGYAIIDGQKALPGG